MVIVKLTGGLGNQLFQYALGRTLSLRHGVPLKLDTAWLTRADQARPYQLHAFAIHEEFATPTEIRRLKGALPDRLHRWLRLPYPATVVRERGASFDPAALAAGPDAYLDGCWQSERYFAERAAVIRADFALRHPLVGQAKELLDEIAGREAISLHVRRGDYVSNAATNAYHGTCSLEYYQEAAARLAARCARPHFYVFSDDPEWTKANLKLDYPATYVVGDVAAPQADLRLMSACRHFVTANSTFSWWGAWLGGHPDKTVIAPKAWFAGAADNPDLIPASWMRL